MHCNVLRYKIADIRHLTSTIIPLLNSLVKIRSVVFGYLNPRRPPPPLRRELLLRPLNPPLELPRLERLLQRVELERR